MSFFFLFYLNVLPHDFLSDGSVRRNLIKRGTIKSNVAGVTRGSATLRLLFFPEARQGLKTREMTLGIVNAYNVDPYVLAAS